ncbi:MAG: hypothetical protein H7123_08090 [Thermoleophilia bacterium]|nr:hypothetical protein [Thermoleophilia bacterium]
MLLDTDTTILAITGGLLNTLMRRRSDVIGRMMFDAFPDQSPGGTAKVVVMNSFRRALNDGVTDALGVLRYEIARPQLDGGGFEERFWTIVHSPYCEPEGVVKYIYQRVEDVTEFVQLNHHDREHLQVSYDLQLLQQRAAYMRAEVLDRSQQLQETNQKLHKSTSLLAASNLTLERQATQLLHADKIKSQFLAMASHELRTPLTAIAGFTSTMLDLDDRLSEQEKHRFLEIIDTQSHRLSRLVDDLLKLSNVESGKLQVHPVAVNVSLAIKNVIRQLGDEDDVSMTGSDDIAVLADEDHVLQIFTNFISNAHKYGAAPIQVSIVPDDDWVEICVSDCGEGVPPEFRPHIFETFARASYDQSSGEGTGLGLSIVKGLAEAQGGEAWYEPNIPRGSRFKARLPRLKNVSHTIDLRAAS